jgi:peptidoglycan hydrolase CwlO-like protein
MHIILAQSSSSGGSLVPLYYIVTIISIMAGGLFALARWLGQQKKKWTQEGQHAQKQNEALTANTDAARRNTEAIDHLTTELKDFVMESRARLAEQDGKLAKHGERIARVENYIRKKVRDGT